MRILECLAPTSLNRKTANVLLALDYVRIVLFQSHKASTLQFPIMDDVICLFSYLANLLFQEHEYKATYV